MTAGQPGRSNAEGAFEITGVPPGKMIIRAEPRVTIGFVNGQSVRNPPVQHPPAFFPGVLDRLDAWPIDVKPGEIIELDFHMPPIFIGSIKTIVSGPDGYMLDHVRVMRPEANQIKNVTVSDDGVGYVDSLREGRYAVAARARSRDTLLAAYELVQITGGEVTVSLSLEPTARVNGRVIVDRGGLPPIDNTRVVAAWTDGTIDLDPLARDEASRRRRMAPSPSTACSAGARSVSPAARRLAGDRDSAGPQRHHVERHRSRSGLGDRDLDRRGASGKRAWLHSCLPCWPSPHAACRIRTGATRQVSGTATAEPRDIVDSRTRGRCAVGRSRSKVRKCVLIDSRIEQETKEIAGRTITTRQFVAGGQDTDRQRRQLRVRRHQRWRVPALRHAPIVSALVPGSGGRPRSHCDSST